MSSIVQKTHGVVAANGGTLAFPNPTKAGNAIFVVIMSSAAVTGSGIFPVTDDSGTNVYDYPNNIFVVGFNFISGGRTVYGFWGLSAASTNPSVTLNCASMQTFTFNHWTTPPLYVWAYEISYIGSPASPPGNAFIWYFDGIPESGNTNNANALQVVPETAHVSGDGGDVSPATNLFFAAVQSFSGGVSAVADNLSVGTVWTLDTAQNGWGVAYAEVVGSADQQAGFTNSTSDDYAGIWAVFGDVEPAPSGLCTGSAPPVGNPYAGGAVPAVQTDNFSSLCNGATTVFTLSKTPLGIVGVYLNGQLRTDYSIAGTTLTTAFTDASGAAYTPITGDALYVVYLAA